MQIRLARSAATRSWTPSKRQRLMMYADVFNALNHVNPRDYLYDVQSSPPQLFRRINSQIPVLPTVGITWEF